MDNSNQDVERATAHTSKMYVLLVCADVDTIHTVSRASGEVFLTPVVGATDDYMPQGQVPGILNEMRNATDCVCVIDFDRNSEFAAATAAGLQRALGAKVMLIGMSRKSNREGTVEAMRAGCLEYLRKPVEIHEVIQALKRLRSRQVLPQTTHPAHGESQALGADGAGRILGFLAVRGGAGATTVVIHLAAFLAQHRAKKVLVIDQQRQLGHVALYMGLPAPKQHFYDLVSNVQYLDRDFLRSFLLRSPTGVDVIPASHKLFAVTGATGEGVHKTLEFLRGLYDYVLVDCARGLARLNVATINAADQLFLVATPEIPALRDLSRYIEQLSRYHFPSGKLKVVINRFRSAGEVKLDDIVKAIGQPVAVTIPNSSSELIASMNSGRPLEPGGKSEFSKQMRKWAMSLVDPGSPEPKPTRSKARLALAPLWG